MTQGLLLIAHGARDPRWAEPFEAIAGRIRARRRQAAVELAFLDFMTPDVPTAGARLTLAGCSSVAVLPLFLGAGGHVRQDLPRLVDALAARHPATRWRLAPAVGEIDAVVSAMADAALALLDGEPSPAP